MGPQTPARMKQAALPWVLLCAACAPSTNHEAADRAAGDLAAPPPVVGETAGAAALPAGLGDGGDWFPAESAQAFHEVWFEHFLLAGKEDATGAALYYADALDWHGAAWRMTEPRSPGWLHWPEETGVPEYMPRAHPHQPGHAQAERQPITPLLQEAVTAWERGETPWRRRANRLIGLGPIYAREVCFECHDAMPWRQGELVGALVYRFEEQHDD